MQETRVQSLGWEDPLEEEMATHSSTLAWRIPWTEEPGGLCSPQGCRATHDWVNRHRHTSQGLTACVYTFNLLDSQMAISICSESGKKKKWKSLSPVQLFAAPWNSPGQNPGVVSAMDEYNSLYPCFVFCGNKPIHQQECDSEWVCWNLFENLCIRQSSIYDDLFWKSSG